MDFMDRKLPQKIQKRFFDKRDKMEKTEKSLTFLGVKR